MGCMTWDDFMDFIMKEVGSLPSAKRLYHPNSGMEAESNGNMCIYIYIWRLTHENWAVIKFSEMMLEIDGDELISLKMGM